MNSVFERMGLQSIGIVVLTTQLILTGAQYECPHPWMPYAESCYKFMELPTDILTAGEHCARDGASLVSVTDRNEHQFVSQWLKNNDGIYREWFTSARRDSASSQNFFWQSDGKELQGFQHWLPDEPSEDGGDIIVYTTLDGKEWGWKLGSANAQNPYICEISRQDVYRIMDKARGYDYGLGETDLNLLERGPNIVRQPVDFIYDTDSVNDYMTMECIADSVPQPEYEWRLKRNQVTRKIETMNQERYTVINGKLIIHSPSETEDNGDYQCVAGNKFGSILSNEVQLSFGYLLDFPKSRRDPVEVEAYAGIGIECNPPKHYPAVLYSWYKDNIMNFIRPNLKPYIFVSHNGKLYFSSVTKDDQGSYYCLVFSPQAGITSAAGKVSVPIDLIVNEAIASNREPQIASGFPVVFPSSPKAGDNVRIECFAWGTDELSYDWSRLDGPMPLNARTSEQGRVLNIPNVELIHAGSYKCSCTRLNGQSTSGTVQLPVDAIPFFTIELENMHVDIGTDLTWRCIAMGIPSVTYSWYRNSTALDVNNLLPEDQARISLQNNVLTIKDVQDKDNGMYQCAAENPHGIRYSAAQLRVLAFAPTFAKYPLQKTTYATRSGAVTITCQPEAAPSASKAWKKDGRDVTPGGRISLLPNGNLRFVDIKDSDEGTYTCVATNQYGTAESSGELKVLATTVLTVPPEGDVVTLNSTTFIPCEASFNPLLDVTYLWYHNNRQIEFLIVRHIGNQVFIDKEPYFARGTGINRGALYIYNTQFFHAGEYTCVVQTSSDRITDSASIQVIGPPSEPAGVIGSSVTDTDIVLSWIAGGSNGRDITSYVVEAKNKYEGVWKKVKSNVRDTSTTITNLSPWNEYKFRVRAINSLGMGNPSDESTQYTTMAAKPKLFPMNVGGGGGKVGDLTITWEPLPEEEHNGPKIGYKIYWKQKFLVDEEWTTAILNGNIGRYVALVGSNNFYSQYDVKVQAFNEEGFGPSSPTVTIWSAEDIPIGVPLNVKAKPYNSTALMVTWTPLEDVRSTIKGVLLGYRVNYWKEQGEDETMSIYRPLGGQRSSGLIIGLEAHTYYYVNVQVFNSAGNGPKSQDFLEETLRLAPSNQPTEVKVKVVDGDRIEVIWRGVSTDQTEEPLQGYMIRYWRQGEAHTVSQDVDAEKKTHMKIGGFEKNVLYNLRVFGYSRGGEGLSSSPAIQFILGQDCKVLEASPEKRFVYACKGCMVHVSYLLLFLTAVIHTYLYKSSNS